jgi:hypothetical protein
MRQVIVIRESTGAVRRQLVGVIAVAVCLIPNARADQFDKYRIACTPQLAAAVGSAVSEARSLLAKAANSLPPNNSATGKKFKRWFGGAEGDSDATLKSVYEEAAGFLVMKTFWCPNASFPGDDPGTYAFVPKGSFNEIFIEAKFFDSVSRGADSQAGTIVHEMTHLSTKAVVVDSDSDGDGKPDYGTTAAARLAKLSASQARRTADNLEYFAEDIAYGIP